MRLSRGRDRRRVREHPSHSTRPTSLWRPPSRVQAKMGKQLDRSSFLSTDALDEPLGDGRVLRLRQKQRNGGKVGFVLLDLKNLVLYYARSISC